MRLVLSVSAKEDLRGIWEYITRPDEITADRYLDQLSSRSYEFSMEAWTFLIKRWIRMNEPINDRLWTRPSPATWFPPLSHL